MSHPFADRNLLYGILALQMNFISRDALLTAMNAWVLDKERPLGHILLEHGALNERDQDFMEVLIAAYVANHGGEFEKSLQALSDVGSARAPLAAISDADVQASLGRLRQPEDPNATRAEWLPQAADNLRFRALRSHAKGGLGEVFVAEDRELHRQVALKEIQLDHADNPDSRARFVVEAEITGGLEHPGIVPVYGLGVYMDGRPYYAMRFIQGDTLKDAIRRYHAEPANNLEFRALLRHFLDVCNAVAYAHSRGVLHRDLKPSNIMLGRFGETLVVDWGLAKSIGTAFTHAAGDRVDASTLRAHSASGSQLTVTGVLIGTPAYMSPEQAMGRTDLTAASDVYSLGAALYMLLSSRPPFWGETEDIIQKVQKGEFPPPRSVKSDMPRSLEAVCLKAMSLRPEDRYYSATLLAADLEHWLADEPVSAYREPIAERIRRWGRRHRALVAGFAALVLTATAALAIGLLIVSEQKARITIAEEETQSALEQSKTAERLAAEQGQLALDTVRNVVDDIVEQLRNRPDLQELRMRLLNTAQTGIQKVARSVDTAGQIDHQAVGIHVGLGDIFLNIDSATEEAKKQYKLAHEMARSLAEANPENAEAQRDLAMSFARLGDVQLQLGHPSAALNHYRHALDIRQKQADTDSQNPQAQRDLADSFHDLGYVQDDLGDTKASLDHYRLALNIRQKLAESDPQNDRAQRSLAATSNNIGKLQQKLGDTKAAQSSYRRALDIVKKQADTDPQNSEAVRFIVVINRNLGDVLLQLGDTKAAQQIYSVALDIAKKLVDKDPLNAQAQRDHAECIEKLGNVQLRFGDTKQAMDSYRLALEMRQRQADTDPRNAEAQRGLSSSLTKMGDVQLHRGDPKAALESYRRALDIDKKQADGDPRNAIAQYYLSVSLEKVGNVQLRLEDTKAALQSYRQSLDIQKRQADADPRNAEAQRGLSISFFKVAEAQLQLKNFDAALEYFQQSLEIAKKLADANPQNAEAQSDLSCSLTSLGVLHERRGDFKTAREYFLRGMDIELKQADADPANVPHQSSLAIDYWNLVGHPSSFDR